jgi:hypothetical protein
MDTKRCYKCEKDLELSAFSKNKQRKDGLQCQCKECQKKIRKTHYEANRQKYVGMSKSCRNRYRQDFLEFLKTQKCKDCGNDDCRVLEFDHLNDKKYNISRKKDAMTLKTMQTELDKCDVVCANCHRIRTCIRANWYKN